MKHLFFEDLYHGLKIKARLRRSDPSSIIYTVEKGVISKDKDKFFICSDVADGDSSIESDKFGYKYSWIIHEGKNYPNRGYSYYKNYQILELLPLDMKDLKCNVIIRKGESLLNF